MADIRNQIWHKLIKNVNIRYSSIHFLWKIADWVYPPVCAGCSSIGQRFCPKCLSEVEVLHSSYCLSCGNPISASKRLCPDCANRHLICNDMASWAVFEGKLRTAIHDMKYKNDLGLGDYFSTFLIDLLRERKWEVDIVLPVPISKPRKKDRGYNQSELLSLPVASFFNLPHSNSALQRIKATESQIRLGASERFLNMEGAFYGNPATLKGKRVLVIDDIITTGATMEQCAKALFTAGAEKVYGLSIAKTRRDNTSSK